MSISVNPPPQQALPDKLLNDPELRDFFLYQQEYLFKLWLRTGGGEDSISISVEDNITRVSIDALLGGKLARLEERVGTLEDSDKSSILSNKVAQLQQLVNELIDELLAELKLQRPNRELENSAIELKLELIKETRLLSARIEEAFETGITIEDIGDGE